MLQYQHILAAIDLGESSLRIIRHSLDLAEHYQAHFSLIHIIESIPSLDETFGEPPALIPDVDLQSQLEKAAQDKFDKIIKGQQLAELLSITILHGIAEHEILKYVEQHHVDLLIVGDHNRKGLLGEIGSTASALVRDVQCDILVLKNRTNN